MRGKVFSIKVQVKQVIQFTATPLLTHHQLTLNNKAKTNQARTLQKKPSNQEILLTPTAPSITATKRTPFTVSFYNQQKNSSTTH